MARYERVSGILFGLIAVAQFPAELHPCGGRGLHASLPLEWPCGLSARLASAPPSEIHSSIASADAAGRRHRARHVNREEGFSRLRI